MIFFFISVNLLPLHLNSDILSDEETLVLLRCGMLAPGLLLCFPIVRRTVWKKRLAFNDDWGIVHFFLWLLSEHVLVKLNLQGLTFEDVTFCPISLFIHLNKRH